MATINLVLDSRYRNKENKSPLIFRMVHNTVPTSFSSGVFIKEEEYNAQDEKRPIRLSNPKAKSLNAELYSLLTEYRARLNSLKTRSAKLSAVELKKLMLSNEINTMSDVSFTSYAKKHAEKYQGATRRVYEYTLRLVDDFFEGKTVLFEDITAGVLHSMDEKWSKTMGVSARGINFRNIRTIFNRAIDDELTDCYPFRKFKIKVVHKEKEYLPLEYMQKLQDLKFTKQEKLRELARDMFLLSFYLCGVNVNDIFSWKKEVLKKDRLVFVRKKIAHHEPDPIKLKIQPEAKAIIDKYAGENYIVNLAETYKTNYETFNGYLKHRIKEIGKRIGYPELSMYYARYSWATYADQLGVDEKVISKSLGHTDQSVAGRHYISYDWKRTDEANRKVIDYVLAQ